MISPIFGHYRCIYRSMGGFVNRRTFCKFLVAGLALAPVSAMASRRYLAVTDEKKHVIDIGTVRVEGNSIPPLGVEQIKDYLHKIRNPDQQHPQDIVLIDHELRLLADVNARLQRLYHLTGYGNFALLGFDEALSFARNFPEVGAFTEEECDFLEQIFYRDAADYGFYGDKQITDLTWKIDEQAYVKVPDSGNYLFRGDAVKKFAEIRDDLGDEVVLTSGIRGLIKQFYLFLNKADSHEGNLSLASRSLAPPGYSYHATGDFDIGQRGLGADNFTEQFTDSMVFRRLADQGIVQNRYNKDNFLGVRYEPWHIKLTI
jgi:D-alanyl-D-alanine carboxypeptidase